MKAGKWCFEEEKQFYGKSVKKEGMDKVHFHEYRVSGMFSADVLCKLGMLGGDEAGSTPALCSFMGDEIRYDILPGYESEGSGCFFPFQSGEDNRHHHHVRYLSPLRDMLWNIINVSL